MTELKTVSQAPTVATAVPQKAGVSLQHVNTKQNTVIVVVKQEELDAKPPLTQAEIDKLMVLSLDEINESNFQDWYHNYPLKPGTFYPEHHLFSDADTESDCEQGKQVLREGNWKPEHKLKVKAKFAKFPHYKSLFYNNNVYIEPRDMSDTLNRSLLPPTHNAATPTPLAKPQPAPNTHTPPRTPTSATVDKPGKPSNDKPPDLKRHRDTASLKRPNPSPLHDSDRKHKHPRTDKVSPKPGKIRPEGKHQECEATKKDKEKKKSDKEHMKRKMEKIAAAAKQREEEERQRLEEQRAIQQEKERSRLQRQLERDRKKADEDEREKREEAEAEREGLATVARVEDRKKLEAERQRKKAEREHKDRPKVEKSKDEEREKPTKQSKTDKSKEDSATRTPTKQRKEPPTPPSAKKGHGSKEPSTPNSKDKATINKRRHSGGSNSGNRSKKKQEIKSPSSSRSSNSKRWTQQQRGDSSCEEDGSSERSSSDENSNASSDTETSCSSSDDDGPPNAVKVRGHSKGSRHKPPPVAGLTQLVKCALCGLNTTEAEAVSSFLSMLRQNDILRAQRRVTLNDVSGALGPLMGPFTQSNTNEKTRKEEMYMFKAHEACVKYAAEGKLHTAASKAWKRTLEKNKCAFCDKNGASIVCKHNKCTRTYHGPCAIMTSESVCVVDKEKSAVYCYEHVPRPTSE